MKNILIATSILLAAACGGAQDKDKEQPVANVSSPSTGSEPAAGEPAATSGGVECAAEILLECGAGFSDGCVGDRTMFHVCVADGEAAGPTCDKEVMKVCPTGQVDACTTTPQYAMSHLCVVAK
jgi:hypothetical protein